MTAAAERARILVGGSTLFSDGGEVPRPLAKSRLALERLRALGEPVVLVSLELGGRTLPDDEGDRVEWVRASLDVPWLELAAFDETRAGRATDPSGEQAAERWADMRSTWAADTLLTSFESSVGPARRSGLSVIRIGARGPGSDPTLPRADYVALDLLDAVRHLLIADTFDAPASGGPRLVAARAPISGGRGPAAGGPDVLERGLPGEG